MLPLGTAAHHFSLPDTNGKTVSITDFKDAPALVIMFICNHCPYVKHLQTALAKFGKEYAAKGASIVAINSNDAENYPDDSPSRMKEDAQRFGYTFPYLYDATQAVAKAYRAACTPDFYVFGKDRKLMYRGQFDASRPGNGIPITGADLRAATDAALAAKPAPADQKPSMGCNIKWKSGNAPDYY
jgi:thiol-disulfide isomerase/thioredoxin